MTNPVIDVAALDYGPCKRVTWGGVDLGGMKGNVTVKIGHAVVNRTSHQYGDAPLSARRKGFTIEVDLEMNEFSLLKLQTALDANSATIASNTLKAGGLAGDEVSYGELRLEPENTLQPKLTVYRAAQVGNPEFAPGDAESAYKVSFKGFIDVSRTMGDQLYRFGDYDDTTAPTVTMSWAGCHATSTGALVINITDTQSLPQINNLIYGNDDDANIAVLDISTPATPILIAGTIAITGPSTTGTATVSFYPTTNWGTVSALAVVMPSVRDRSGNRLANAFMDEQDIS